MMKFKILFIEDNKTKSESIKIFLLDKFPNINIEIRESFTSGLRELFSESFDLLLVDMSLPSRDGLSSNSINDFKQFGGHRIMSEMKRKKLATPTILITMFSEFGVNESYMDLKRLDEILLDEFDEFYRGYVFYSSKEENWKEKLSFLIEQIL